MAELTVKDYVNIFKSNAYCFRNGFDNTFQYFIPINKDDETVEVQIDPTFDEVLYSKLVNKETEEEICSIKSLIRTNFLDGDSHIFVVPIKFETLEDDIVIYYEDEDATNESIASEPVDED